MDLEFNSMFNQNIGCSSRNFELYEGFEMDERS